MTEDEAKTKWCPFARVERLIGSEKESWGGTPVTVAASSANRGPAMSDALCIGSACAAWRWGADVTVDPSPEPFALVVRGSPEALRRNEALAQRLAAARPGFCGLSGAQQ